MHICIYIYTSLSLYIYIYIYIYTSLSVIHIYIYTLYILYPSVGRAEAVVDLACEGGPLLLVACEGSVSKERQ